METQKKATTLIILMFLLIVFIAIGGIFFLKNVQRKALTDSQRKEPIITTIGSLSPGLVQVTGTVLPPDNRIICPISNRECVYFKWFLEEYRTSRGTHGLSWFLTTSNTSFDPIVVEDKTGKVNVEVIVSDPQTQGLHEINFDSSNMPQYVKETLKEKLGVDDTYFQSHTQIRVREVSILSGETVTVVGTAKNDENGFSISRGKEDYTFIISGQQIIR